MADAPLSSDDGLHVRIAEVILAMDYGVFTGRDQPV